MNEAFEWKRLLFNGLPYVFLAEVVFRCVVMFVVLLIALRSAGKRGVRQLSVFEIVIIIALGSAAGDPMFYEDVGLVPAIAVFVCIILMYRLVTWLTGKSKWFERMVEGKPECLIIEGQFAIEEFAKESLAQDEFFMELRVKSIEHLGQVKYAFIEPSGQISVFFYADEEVKYGLPLLPGAFSKKSEEIAAAGIYACSFCGNTLEQQAGRAVCKRCGKKEWVRAIRTKRIA